jgi:integrase
MTTPTPKKLSFGRIALYSMASAGLNILAITIDTWILYFYAPPPDSGRPQYLPLALIGVLLTVASIWDAAILICLLDTGARASEFLNVDLEDLNQASGTILIRHGKGSKPREVYLGRLSKQILRKYLKHRTDNSLALWVTHPRFGSGRLSYDGLREVLTRRAADAQVEEPSLHDFRRAFALAMLRNGTDVYTLAKLMGHEGITVLQRYLKQTYQDTEAAHRRAGPVDNSQFLSIF